MPPARIFTKILMKDNLCMKTTCMWQRVREHEYTAAEIHDVHDVPNTVMKRR